MVQEQDQTRFNSLVSGETNIMHTSNGDTTNRLATEVENGTIEVDQITNNLETGYVLLNVGDDSLPTSDVRVRQALAYGFDYETRLQARSGGVPEIANGPFPPGTPGYLEDTGFPTYDPDKARELVDEYEAENGPIEIAYKTTTDEFNLVTAQLYQQFWEDIGIDVTLDQIQQGSFIGLALTGDFEAFGWRNHAGFDPDQQNIWWNSENGNPPPDFGLNFGRIRDDVIDENLDIIRTNPDPRRPGPRPPRPSTAASPSRSTTSGSSGPSGASGTARPCTTCSAASPRKAIPSSTCSASVVPTRSARSGSTSPPGTEQVEVRDGRPGVIPCAT